MNGAPTEKKCINADGFWRIRRNGGAFLMRAIHFQKKGSTICIWFGDTSEAGSAPGEQKANLVCSSKGC